MPTRGLREITTPEPEIGIAAIRDASSRLGPWIHETPVLTSKTFDARCGGTVYFKCENFQKVGAFKYRGAMNALLQLNDAEKGTGVVTHSSGNHGQALAAAGKALAISMRACRYCGAALSEGEKEDECSSAFNVDTVGVHGGPRKSYAD